MSSSGVFVLQQRLHEGLDKRSIFSDWAAEVRREIQLVEELNLKGALLVFVFVFSTAAAVSVVLRQALAWAVDLHRLNMVRCGLMRELGLS